jgi:hypothetical protein
MPFPRFTKMSKFVHGSITSGMTSNINFKNINRNKTLSDAFPWIRIFSGAETGLILSSATLTESLGLIDSTNATANSTLTTPGMYGSRYGSGPVGRNFSGEWIYPSVAYQIIAGNPVISGINTVEQDWVLRPSPVVTGLEIKEGKDHISRVGTLVIKCFSLSQLEEMQKYFMEPGFSILIEYGWNTTESLKYLIPTTNERTIIQGASDENLNANVLNAKRINSYGNYDSFFAFIVGANVESENENFIINVNLRGMPGLPTFLQTQHNINKLKVVTDASGKPIKTEVDRFQSVRLYSISDISKPGPNDIEASGRRYKYMFNSLPSQRQTPEVAKFVTKAETGVVDGFDWRDLIGFDYIINQTVDSYKSDSMLDSVGKALGLIKEFKIGTWSVPKEKLGSTYKYINFGLAIRILNANNGLLSYKIGNKNVSVRIDPRARIGAFPKMFSTDPTKLVIPGEIPDFFAYYLNDGEVPTESILNSSFDASIRGWSFVQNSPLPLLDAKGNPPAGYSGFWEKAGYYGDIEMLYINFDIFSKAIKNSDNKSIKDVLLDMLNEMSSAVNSFWNFQLIEKVDEGGDVSIGIIDENWAGYCPIKQKDIDMFNHAGELSTFLEANLNVDIPSEMANQIILKRESYTSQPNSQGLEVGGVFTNKKDLFFTGIEYENNLAQSDKNNNVGGKPIDQLKKDLDAKKILLVNWKKNLIPDPDWLQRIGSWLSGTGGANITQFVDKTTKELVYTQVIATGGGYTSEKGSNTAEGVKWDKLLAEIKELEDAAIETQTTTLSNNINKIDIIANPEITGMGIDTPKQAFENPTSGKLKQSFRIYCCMDTQLFDVFKNNAFEAYGNKTSILLPIKYTFKIMGKSGLRRGDIFNIRGIPERYAKNGFFQIINIEQNIEGNLWTTTVTGQYRQDSRK